MKPSEAMGKKTPKSPVVRETKDQRALRASQIVALLKRYYPNAKCSLDFENPFQLLVATALSAQCTDKRVNQVTPALFARFPDPGALSKASLEELEELVRSTGFYKNKAKNLKACATVLVDKHEGIVPNRMDALSQLPGVGRKTANVVLGNAFGIPGMVVDTHVTRLTNLLKLASGEDAVKLEKQLEEIIAREDWILFSHLLIEHGRAVCVARRPKCHSCFLSELCPSSEA